MSMRFCPKCDGEVEASGGYCLLGHRLALTPLVASIKELRDEVDRAFDDATLEVAAVSSGSTGPMAAVAAPAVAPQAVGTVEAPVRPRRVGPPPPPPPRKPAALRNAVEAPAIGRVPTQEELLARKADVWKTLEDEVDLASDPIGAFAPPPSMDWGPRDSRLHRKPTGVLKRFKRSKGDDSAA